MLKKADAKDVRPKIFNCDDLVKKAMNKHNPNVAPDPPMIANELLNSPAKAMCDPDAFWAKFDKRIGVIKALIMLAP